MLDLKYEILFFFWCWFPLFLFSYIPIGDLKIFLGLHLDLFMVFMSILLCICFLVTVLGITIYTASRKFKDLTFL